MKYEQIIKEIKKINKGIKLGTNTKYIIIIMRKD